jgi:hypothetical protein
MKKFYLFIFSIMFLFSCGHQTGVIQKAEKGYLQFSGNWEWDAVVVRIDDREPFELKHSDKKILYEITPGKHSIKVSRNNNVVIDRVIFLESQATFEVKIP